MEHLSNVESLYNGKKWNHRGKHSTPPRPTRPTRVCVCRSSAYTSYFLYYSSSARDRLSFTVFINVSATKPWSCYGDNLKALKFKQAHVHRLIAYVSYIYISDPHASHHSWITLSPRRGPSGDDYCCVYIHYILLPVCNTVQPVSKVTYISNIYRSLHDYYHKYSFLLSFCG